MTVYKMLSDGFIDKHRKFMAANSNTMFSKDNSGAHDTVSPQLRQALKRSGVTPKQLGNALKNVQRAYDQMTGAPDPEVVNMILEGLKESLPDAAIAKIMKSLHDKWPGCVGEINEPGEHADDDFEDDDDEEDNPDSPANPNPNQNYRGQGGNPFGTDNPPPFSGMPKPGGRMVPVKKNSEMASDSITADYHRMFPMAARIGFDNQIPMSPRSHAVTPQVNRPAHAKPNRRGFAMDAAEHTAANSDEDSYEKMFGRGSSRVVEV